MHADVRGNAPDGGGKYYKELELVFVYLRHGHACEPEQQPQRGDGHDPHEHGCVLHNATAVSTSQSTCTTICMSIGRALRDLHTLLLGSVRACLAAALRQLAIELVADLLQVERLCARLELLCARLELLCARLGCERCRHRLDAAQHIRADRLECAVRVVAVLLRRSVETRAQPVDVQLHAATHADERDDLALLREPLERRQPNDVLHARVRRLRAWRAASPDHFAFRQQPPQAADPVATGGIGISSQPTAPIAAYSSTVSRSECVSIAAPVPAVLCLQGTSAPVHTRTG